MASSSPDREIRPVSPLRAAGRPRSPYRDPDAWTEHNASPQVGVDRNPDPVLNVANEHVHPHKHHGASALKGEKPSDVVYSDGVDTNRNTNLLDKPEQDYKTHTLNHTIDHNKETAVTGNDSIDHDVESGRLGSVEKGQGQGYLSFYYSRYKIFFHLAIWGVWTA